MFGKYFFTIVTQSLNLWSKNCCSDVTYKVVLGMEMRPC